MKVFLVFQRFREDNESIDTTYFNDDKGADLLKIFDSEEKAKEYIEELYKIWLFDREGELDYLKKEDIRGVWDDDFNTFIKVEEVL